MPFSFAHSRRGMWRSLLLFQVRLWDARQGALVKEYTGHSDMILDLSVLFDADAGDYAVTCSDDTTVKVFAV